MEIDILMVDDEKTHEYDECLIDQLSFTGYGCGDKFCEWLSTKSNSNSTAIAHNGARYDL